MSPPESHHGGLSRRALLRAGVLGAGVLLVPAGCGWPVNETQSSAGAVLPSTTALPTPFRSSLAIPPVLQPSRSDESGDYYQITQRVGHAQIVPGRRTALWGYNGTFPGPTIRARSGRQVVVRHRNNLPVPTVVHLHGGRTPPESDGYPTDYVLPTRGGWSRSDLHHPGRIHEGTFDYTYPLEQRAATLWYHDHRMDFTGPAVWRGLAGFFLVTDDEQDALPLPDGDRDIPLMITDRSFAPDGTMPYPSVDRSLRNTPGVTDEYMSGVLGDCILVNGTAWPAMDVAAVRYRFRILNASNARRYRLTLDPEPTTASFVQIATGQGLLAYPVPLDAIDIAQGERFDVVIDFSGYSVGQRITMRNQYGDGNTALVMQFRVTGRAADSSRIPRRLSTIERLDPGSAVAHRTFVFERGGAERDGRTLWTVNGKAFDPGRIDARVRRGTTERWTIEAKNLPHPFHIHEDAFQVVGVDGQDAPGPYNSGWKDVINLDSGGRGDLLIHFTGYPGTYVFHCHNLEHEDMMMMANFQIV